MRLKLALLVLALASLACMEQVSTVTPEVTLIVTATLLSPTKTATVPTATAQAVTTEQQSAAVVQAVVNVRNAPDGDVVGYLIAGDTVTVLECTELWCKIEQGWVWRGCLSNRPADLGCSAK